MLITDFIINTNDHISCGLNNQNSLCYNEYSQQGKTISITGTIYAQIHLYCNYVLNFDEPTVCLLNHSMSLSQKATIHQVTTMLATYKNVLFPCHNLVATGTDDPTLIITRVPARVLIRVTGHQYQ